MATSQTIAVIEDEAALREATRSVLHSAGYATRLFDSAESFLRARSDEGTACLVIDVSLPGMSGLDLQRHLTLRGSAIPVVIVTGRDDRDGRLEARARDFGARGFLHKPYGDSDLLLAIHAALGRA
jgi:two-component system, LuxR family, response regulator FixJ